MGQTISSGVLLASTVEMEMVLEALNAYRSKDPLMGKLRGELEDHLEHELQRRREWHTTMASTQIDALDGLIRATEQAIRQDEEMPGDNQRLYIQAVLKESYRRVVRELGGTVL